MFRILFTLAAVALMTTGATVAADDLPATLPQPTFGGDLPLTVTDSDDGLNINLGYTYSSSYGRSGSYGRSSSYSYSHSGSGGHPGFHSYGGYRPGYSGWHGYSNPGATWGGNYSRPASWSAYGGYPGYNYPGYMTGSNYTAGSYTPGWYIPPVTTYSYIPVTNPNYYSELGYYQGYWSGHANSTRVMSASNNNHYQYRWRQYPEGTAFRYWDTNGTRFSTWTDGDGVAFNLNSKQGAHPTLLTNSVTDGVSIDLGKKQSATPTATVPSVSTPIATPVAVTTVTTTPDPIPEDDISINLGKRR